MAFQKALESAKDKPKDEKQAIAGGIAVAVVAVLLVGWAFFFFRSIQRGTELQKLGGGAQDEFNFSTVRDAQSELMKHFDDISAIIDARNQSSSGNQQESAYDDPYSDQQTSFGE